MINAEPRARLDQGALEPTHHALAIWARHAPARPAAHGCDMGGLTHKRSHGKTAIDLTESAVQILRIIQFIVGVSWIEEDPVFGIPR
ncbi:MAG: hypothetical protein ACK5UG_10250 [Synechococcaceae cyanobacterium]|jgi:hypothetical protein